MTQRKARRARPSAQPGEEPARRELQVEDGTVARWYIMGAIIQDTRSRMIHSQIAWPILEAYYSKHGKGRASYRFLAKATGLTHGSISTATSDLVEWGYFTREVGGGKAATTYVPNWEFAAAAYAAGPLGVLHPPSALPQPSAPQPQSVPQPQNACVLPPRNAIAGSVPQPQNETLLLSPLKAGLSKIGAIGSDALPGGLTAPVSAAPIPRKFKVEVSDYDTDDDGTRALFLEFSPVDGGKWESVFLNLELGDLDAEIMDGAPNSEFAGFWRSLQFLGHPEQPSDLVGCHFCATGTGDDFTFHTEAEAQALINGETDTVAPEEANPPPDWLLTTPEPLPQFKAPRWVPDANAPWRRNKAA